MGQVIASVLLGMAKTMLTQEVFKRVFIDMGWYLANQTNNNLDDFMMNTVSKALDYKYKPELDAK